MSNDMKVCMIDNTCTHSLWYLKIHSKACAILREFY